MDAPATAAVRALFASKMDQWMFRANGHLRSVQGGLHPDFQPAASLFGAQEFPFPEAFTHSPFLFAVMCAALDPRFQGTAGGKAGLLCLHLQPHLCH
jgi:hypothetical protein